MNFFVLPAADAEDLLALLSQEPAVGRRGLPVDGLMVEERFAWREAYAAETGLFSREELMPEEPAEEEPQPAAPPRDFVCPWIVPPVMRTPLLEIPAAITLNFGAATAAQVEPGEPNPEPAEFPPDAPREDSAPPISVVPAFMGMRGLKAVDIEPRADQGLGRRATAEAPSPDNPAQGASLLAAAIPPPLRHDEASETTVVMRRAVTLPPAQLELPRGFKQVQPAVSTPAPSGAPAPTMNTAFEVDVHPDATATAKAGPPPAIPAPSKPVTVDPAVKEQAAPAVRFARPQEEAEVSTEGKRPETKTQKVALNRDKSLTREASLVAEKAPADKPAVEAPTRSGAIVDAAHTAARQKPAEFIAARPAAARVEAPPFADALRASAPVRDQALPGAASPIRVELGGPGEASVRMEVVRMGGEIRVSVNAGNAGLASVLQQGLPELQQRFDHTGVDAMIRLPDETGAIIATEKSGNQNSSSESPAHSQGDDARWPGGDRNGQQRQNRQTKHWLQQWMMED